MKKAATQENPSPIFYEDVPEFPGYSMDIHERHRLVTIPPRCFRSKRMDPHDVYENNSTLDVYRHTTTSKVDVYNAAPDMHNRLVVLPDRMFRFHKNAKEEDILGNAGGEEESRQSTTKPFRPGCDDDVYGARSSWYSS